MKENMIRRKNKKKIRLNIKSSITKDGKGQRKNDMKEKKAEKYAKEVNKKKQKQKTGQKIYRTKKKQEINDKKMGKKKVLAEFSDELITINKTNYKDQEGGPISC